MSDTTLITIICVSVILLIGVVVIHSKKKPKTKENTSTTSATADEKKTDDTDKSSVIRYSDNYTPPKEEPIIDTKHKIYVILKDDMHAKRWICPDCETENNLSDYKCCVCNWHYVR